jgi:hypothetical protein
VPVVLDAAGSTDPDDDALRYRWVFYPEAGAGIPGVPLIAQARLGSDPMSALDSTPAAAPSGGPPALPARIEIAGGTSPRASVVPRIPGMAHVILVVEDDGVPSLTSYRRVILRIAGAR